MQIVTGDDKDWLFNHFKADYKYGVKKKRDHSSNKKKADAMLRYCKKCNIVWEYDRVSKQNLYYDDFPTYGKIREECPKCKNHNH